MTSLGAMIDFRVNNPMAFQYSNFIRLVNNWEVAIDGVWTSGTHTYRIVLENANFWIPFTFFERKMIFLKSQVESTDSQKDFF